MLNDIEKLSSELNFAENNVYYFWDLINFIDNFYLLNNFKC